LTAWVSNTNSQVLPSGADFATAPAPVLPEAPGRFSMMTVAPRRCCRPVCARRAIGSTVPPGGNGTMIFITPDGQFCALAILLRVSNGAATAPTRMERRVIRMKPHRPVDSGIFLSPVCPGRASPHCMSTNRVSSAETEQWVASKWA
jgi:hypothetical protein